MAQSFYPITPVEVTPSTAGSYQDVDVSAYVPAGATGVVLHCINNSGDDSLRIGLRKNGSTDDNNDAANSNMHYWAAIGVDTNRVLEIYVGSTTGIDIILVAYTTSGVTFLTNSVAKAPGSTSSWVDTDCSANAPGAVGLIFDCFTSYTTNDLGLRKNGSTDNRYNPSTWYKFFAFIGCDASQIVELYFGSLDARYTKLVGYITEGAVFNTNGTDISLGGTGAWTDLASLPATANMGFIEVGMSDASFGLRKNGSSENIYQRAKYHVWGVVECDSSQVIEGEISNTAQDFFLDGYSTAGEAAIELSLIEGLKAGDTPSESMAASPVLNEGLKSGDVLSGLGQFTAEITEGLKLGDIASFVLAYYLTLTEGIKGGDAGSIDAVMNPALGEGLKLGDAPLAAMLASLNLTDGVKLSDADLIELVGETVFYLTLAEGLKAGDAPEAVASMNPILSEGFKIGEALLEYVLSNVTLSEGVTLGDAVAKSMAASKSITDGLKAGDIELIVMISSLLLTDGVKLGDAEIKSMLANAQLTEGFKLGDTEAIILVTMGRLLKVMVITSQHRDMTALTSQYRLLKSLTALYRHIHSHTGG